MIEPFSKGLGLLGQSPPDYRDRPLPLARVAVELPDFVDLRERAATPRTVFDQGNLGSCTANAANVVAQYVERKHNDPDWDRLSRLWTYYYTREKIGTVDVDSGGFIRDAFAVLAERGAPREKFWPYVETNFRVEPTVAEWRAAEHRALEYLRIAEGDVTAMQACLADGYPFAYGFAVYRSFWTIGQDGRWEFSQGIVDGYHAVAAWGYDFRPGAFGFDEGGWIIRNSWDDDWGDDGYFYVPRYYLPSEAFDCWTIRKMYR